MYNIQNKTVLVTAGPTYEYIDPVRFIGNLSSGKMGIEIAKSFANKGANVILVLGPTSLDVQDSHIKVIKVISAQDMFSSCKLYSDKSDIIVCAAAVADFKPKNVALNKIKKNKSNPTIDLVKTVDILSELGKAKKDNQYLVGFALETENVIDNASEKRIRKNADMILANTLSDGTGFNKDTNQVIFITNNECFESDLLSKENLAKNIVNEIIIRKV